MIRRSFQYRPSNGVDSRRPLGLMEQAGKRLEQEHYCLKKRDELMLFVSAGDIERVKFVLGGAKKVDIGMRDFAGNNLVALAVESNRILVLLRLIEAGAAVDNVDYVGMTPLMHAATHDFVECCYHCCTHAPQVLDSQRRRDGRTASCFAWTSAVRLYFVVACLRGNSRGSRVPSWHPSLQRTQCTQQNLASSRLNWG